jgi:hypothetical protein
MIGNAEVIREHLNDSRCRKLDSGKLASTGLD